MAADALSSDLFILPCNIGFFLKLPTYNAMAEKMYRGYSEATDAINVMCRAASV